MSAPAPSASPTSEPRPTGVDPVPSGLPGETAGVMPGLQEVTTQDIKSKVHLPPVPARRAVHPDEAHPDPEGGWQDGPDALQPPATWVDRVEAFISRLSTRDNFWHRIFSLVFLPLAFWSGIRMKRNAEGHIEDRGASFTAVLPFKKFNKNWYNAMAGASLLANTEIAGGMYVFGEAGGDYTVVCKNLNYTFLRPCMGPAVYRVNPRDDLCELVEAGGEFNITLDMDIRQLGVKPGEREKRVGKAEVTFHVTPKTHVKAMKKARAERDKRKSRRVIT